MVCLVFLITLSSMGCVLLCFVLAVVMGSDGVNELGIGTREHGFESVC